MWLTARGAEGATSNFMRDWGVSLLKLQEPYDLYEGNNK